MGFEDKLDEYLDKKKGVFHTSSTYENFLTAQHLYSNVKGSIIATAFHENPYYGDKDLALKFKGESLVRITSENVCDKESEQKIVELLSNLNNFKLIVLSDNKFYTRIDGMFCKLLTGEYFSFLSLRQPEGNIGVVLKGDHARAYYEYYNKIIA
jgi:hypothetical protein